MNSFKHLDKLTNFWIANKMPIDQVVYLSDADMKETCEFLTSIGVANYVTEVKYPESEHGVVVERIHYRGYRINIINIESLP